MSTAEIPLFPLNTVLFPGGPLPLRIFETRYTDMVRRCMREQSAFGVVLIRAGAEVGEVANTAEIGTTARIVDFYQLPDRLLGITCAGEKKFRVLARRRQPDGLNVGTVEWLPEEPKLEVPGEHAHLAALLRKVLTSSDWSGDSAVSVMTGHRRIVKKRWLPTCAYPCSGRARSSGRMASRRSMFRVSPLRPFGRFWFRIRSNSGSSNLTCAA